MPCHSIHKSRHAHTDKQKDRQTDRRTDGQRQAGHTDIQTRTRYRTTRRTDRLTDGRHACMHASNMHKYAEQCTIHLWSGKFSGCVQCATQSPRTLRRLWKTLLLFRAALFQLMLQLVLQLVPVSSARTPSVLRRSLQWPVGSSLRLLSLGELRKRYRGNFGLNTMHQNLHPFFRCISFTFTLSLRNPTQLNCNLRHIFHVMDHKGLQIAPVILQAQIFWFWESVRNGPDGQT